MKREAKMFGIVTPKGTIVTGTDCYSEERAWEIALGWPTAKEVNDERRRGSYCAVLTVTWEEPEQ